MLPQEIETIKAEEVRASEQDVQPYFEHQLWSEYCCANLVKNFYMNVLECSTNKKHCITMSIPKHPLLFITTANKNNKSKHIFYYSFF